MTTPSGYVSNEVIALQLVNLTEEIKLLRQELVRRDVYEEQRRADRIEMDGIKRQLEQAGNRRWALWLAGAAGGLSLLWKLFEGLVQAQG
jgi:hypothetical protein